MVQFLKTKFCDKTSPLYNVKEIDESKVETLRAEMRPKKISSIEGSASFQVLHFKPNWGFFCSHLFMHIWWMFAVGLWIMWSIFQSHHTGATEATDNFFLPGSTVAVTAAEYSVDTVWFIKIANDIGMANNLIRDSYGNCILAGQHYLKGHSLEKDNMVKNRYIYKVNKKHFIIFFKESIFYPIVRFYDIPEGLLLKNEDFVDIFVYAQSTGISTVL